MRPSFEELNYFFEVTKAENLSRASANLGISQPTLSLAIKRLERSLGAALFIRHKQGVSLTIAGKHLLTRVKRLLQLWEETRSVTLSSQEEIKGRFILGCHSAIAMHVSGFLPDLLEEYPNLEIHLSHAPSQQITESIINSSIDIGIVTKPFKHPDLIVRKLYDNKMGFWTGPGNRKIQTIHSPNATLICDPGLIQTQFLLKELKVGKINIRRMITTNNLEVVANLTLKGAGIGILPFCIAQKTYEGKMKLIPKLPLSSEEICLIYRNENRNIKAIHAITTRIKEILRIEV